MYAEGVRDTLAERTARERRGGDDLKLPAAALAAA